VWQHDSTTRNSCALVVAQGESLGVSLEPGSLVLAGVDRGGCAERAGCHRFIGREIVSANNTPVPNRRTFAEITGGSHPREVHISFQVPGVETLTIRKLFDSPLPATFNKHMCMIKTTHPCLLMHIGSYLRSVNGEDVNTAAAAARLSAGESLLILGFERSLTEELVLRSFSTNRSVTRMYTGDYELE